MCQELKMFEIERHRVATKDAKENTSDKTKAELLLLDPNS